MFRTPLCPSSGASQLHMQFINAKQAGEVYEYKNTKQKLHRTIAAIWYNTTRDQRLHVQLRSS